MNANAIWFGVVVLAAAVVPLLLQNRCRHVDEDGRSELMWLTDEKKRRRRGYCWRCHRQTRGWA